MNPALIRSSSVTIAVFPFDIHTSITMMEGFMVFVPNEDNINVPIPTMVGKETLMREEIGARAKENQGTRTDLTSVRNLTEVDTKKELAKIAVRAKENQRLSEGVGYKGMQISANLSIDTREELAKIAGALRSF